MKREIDVILKQALTPADEPDARLNQAILHQAEEMTRMARMRKRRIPAAILAASITLVVGSTAVFAAWKYLSPAQMAEELSNQSLAEAFQSEDAVQINETQECGGYRITLLGTTAGKNISESVGLDWDGAGQLKDDMFYAAVAIERADGTPMPDTSDDAYGEEAFLVSPYIKGLDPVCYNVFTMGGGYSEFVKDGVQYRMLELDNIEMFADRGIYMGVSSGSFYDGEAFCYDESTGELTRNEDYEGVNALFVLPLDPAKADPKAAQKFLDQVWEKDDDEEPLEMTAGQQEIEDFMSRLTAENLKEYADVIESTVQVCRPNEKGEFFYSWELDSGMGGEETVYLDNFFPDRKPGLAIGGYCSGGTLDSLCIDTYTLNEDGTVTVAIYRPKTK